MLTVREHGSRETQNSAKLSEDGDSRVTYGGEVTGGHEKGHFELRPPCLDLRKRETKSKGANRK